MDIKKNYFVTYLDSSFTKDPIRLQCIPKTVNLISIDDRNSNGSIFPSVGEYLVLKIIKNKPNYAFFFSKTVLRIFRREFKRQFWNIKFDKVVRFGGIDEDSVGLLGLCDVKERILVEYPATKNIIKTNPLFKAYWNLAKRTNAHIIFRENKLFESYEENILE